MLAYFRDNSTRVGMPGEDVARSFYEAFGRRDFAGVAALVHPEGFWSVGGRSRLAGTHRGPDAVAGLYKVMDELSEGTFRAWGPDTHDLCVGEVHVILLDRFTAQRDGKTLDSHEAWCMHVVDGKLAECFTYLEDQASFDAFWA